VSAHELLQHMVFRVGSSDVRHANAAHVLARKRVHCGALTYHHYSLSEAKPQHNSDGQRQAYLPF
jgi:hypothetical protein